MNVGKKNKVKIERKKKENECDVPQLHFLCKMTGKSCSLQTPNYDMMSSECSLNMLSSLLQAGFTPILTARYREGGYCEEITALGLITVLAVIKHSVTLYVPPHSSVN